MTARKIYERVAFEKEISEQRFCELATEAIQLIISQFGEKYTLCEGGNFYGVEKFSDNIDVLEDYTSCIVDYILFRLGDAERYELYTLKSNNAYTNVWRRLSKGRAVRPKLGGEYFV